MEKFWIVCSYSPKLYATLRRVSYLDAAEEAERLAHKEGRRFIVFEAKSAIDVEVQPPTYVWNIFQQSEEGNEKEIES